MRHQSVRDASDSLAEVLAREAREHDRRYAHSRPFGLPTLQFTPEEVWRVNDHSFKKGTFRRGYRRRRLFQLMELDRIAGQKVLDIGCGTGKHTVLLAMYGADAYGFDISPVGVAAGVRMAQANNVANSCHFEVASASAMPHKDEYFDIILLHGVLHHVIKYPNVYHEIWRVLKPGGKLFVADGLRDNPVYNTLRWCYRALSKPKPDAGDVDLKTADLEEFAKPYAQLHLERFTLLEGLREGFAHYHNNSLPVRALCFFLFAADQMIFRILPRARNYTSEFVLAMSKPENAGPVLPGLDQRSSITKLKDAACSRAA